MPAIFPLERPNVRTFGQGQQRQPGRFRGFPRRFANRAQHRGPRNAEIGQATNGLIQVQALVQLGQDRDGQEYQLAACQMSKRGRAGPDAGRPGHLTAEPRCPSSDGRPSRQCKRDDVFDGDHSWLRLIPPLVRLRAVVLLAVAFPFPGADVAAVVAPFGTLDEQELIANVVTQRRAHEIVLGQRHQGVAECLR